MVRRETRFVRTNLGVILKCPPGLPNRVQSGLFIECWWDPLLEGQLSAHVSALLAIRPQLEGASGTRYSLVLPPMKGRPAAVIAPFLLGEVYSAPVRISKGTRGSSHSTVEQSHASKQ